MPSESTRPRTQFAMLSRILHWLMAAMLLSMLFIGAAMVSSLSAYHRLLAIHRPLGIAKNAPARVEKELRFLHRPPPQKLPEPQ